MNTQKEAIKKVKLNYWLFAIAPLTMVAVYVLYALNYHDMILRKDILEGIHIALIAAASLVFIAAAIKQKEPFRLAMTALCIAFLCREIHFVGTSLGVYIAIAIIVTYAISKWKQIEAVIEQGKIKHWLYATGFAYILSQVIARRVFKYMYLPKEQELHVMLEEAVETVAHLSMLITAVITLRTKTVSKQMADSSQNQPAE